jgi:hypothetical protein
MTLPIADSFMHKFSCDCAIDAAADGPDDTSLWATNIANSGNFFAYEFFLILLGEQCKRVS